MRECRAPFPVVAVAMLLSPLSSAGMEPLQALQTCRAGIEAINAGEAPPADLSLAIANACRELFEEPGCRALIDRLTSVSPEARAVQWIDACIKPLCRKIKPPATHLCLPGVQAMDPREHNALLLEMQWRIIRQEVAPLCPKVKARAPMLCAGKKRPENAAEKKEFLTELTSLINPAVTVQGFEIDPVMLELLRVSVLFSAMPWPQETKPIPVEDEKEVCPGLALHIQLEGGKTLISLDAETTPRWTLPAKMKPDELRPLAKALEHHCGKPVVLLIPSDNVPYETLVVVMDALRATGFDEIVISELIK